MSIDARKGRIRYVWQRLYAWVEAVMEDNGYVNWQIEDSVIDVAKARFFPFVSIEVDDVIHENETYGRTVSDTSTGVMAYMPFTMYIYMKKVYEPDKTEYYNVYEVSEYIFRYIEGRTTSSTEDTTHRIVGVDELFLEESQPLGLRRHARMILSGRVRTKRLDEP